MLATLAISSLVLIGVACSLIFLAIALGGCHDAALEQHRVRASGDVLQSFVDNRLRQNGRGGRAVSGDVVGLGRGFLEKLRAHVFIRVVEFDFLGNGHAVVSHGWRAELLVERDVAPLGTERRCDRIGELIHAAL